MRFDSPYLTTIVVLKCSINSFVLLDQSLKAAFHGARNDIGDIQADFGRWALDILQFANVHTL